MPHYQFNDRKQTDMKLWYKNWAVDPLYQGDYLSVHNLLNQEKAMKDFELNVAPKVKTPFLMILAGKEILVDNQASKNFFETCEIQDKDLIEYDDA